MLRRFLLWFESLGHNPGGIHAHYRSNKTFVRWYIDEIELDGYRDPFWKVKAPKVDDSPLLPAPLPDINAMINTCEKTWYGLRDMANFLCLLDTGACAVEFLSLNVEDVNLRTGNVFIRIGKGGKSRSVFVGKTARRALRKYLRTWTRGPVWTVKSGERLSYWGLREVLCRRSLMAWIDSQSAHDFRRAFAINMLRVGTDLETLRRLMGHSDLSVLRRYLALVDDDLQRAHPHASPADQLRNLNRRR